ncbi:MAG TPA: hypothetical protein PKM88_10110 [bacterium]|nr:hypothetical protein [bacterium]
MSWQRLFAMAVLAAVLVNGWGKAGEQLKAVVNLPYRILTLHELKQLDRLLGYALVDSTLRTTLHEFCTSEVASKGRDAALDYWHTGYRLSCHGRLYGNDETFSLRADERDGYTVVSAGPDRKFITADDLTSRQSGHAEVDRLEQLVQRRARD